MYPTVNSGSVARAKTVHKLEHQDRVIFTKIRFSAHQFTVIPLGHSKTSVQRPS